MADAFSIFLQVLFLVVFGWIGVFGGIGAALAHHRGNWWLQGFLLGAFFGPFGWLWIVYRTRGQATSPANDPILPTSAPTPTSDRYSDLDL